MASSIPRQVRIEMHHDQTIQAILDELVALRGREMYRCSDGIFWHRREGYMVPLDEDGNPVTGARWYRVWSRKPTEQTRISYPTLPELQAIEPSPLERVTELDLLRAKIVKLEDRVRELEG